MIKNHALGFNHSNFVDLDSFVCGLTFLLAERTFFKKMQHALTFYPPGSHQTYNFLLGSLPFISSSLDLCHLIEESIERLCFFVAVQSCAVAQGLDLDELALCVFKPQLEIYSLRAPSHRVASHFKK